MMDITKSQSDFEATFPIPRHVIRCGAGYAVTSYGAWEANSYLDLWKGWQAGRESILVELPPRKSADRESEKYPDMTMYEAMMREGIWNDCVFECEKILRTAGIRIKGESE